MLKALIKDFIPPVAIKLKKKMRGLEDSREYASYSQAMQRCTSDAYQNADLCNMVADKTIAYLETLKNKPFELHPTNVFLLSAITKYINTFDCKTLKVLDFGGSCGIHYYILKRFIPADISLKWYVVETPQMAKSAIDRGINNSELSFVGSIDDVDSEIDFIHSSGAIQYVPEPYQMTDILLSIKANWMFFNRMMFNENDRDFVTVQKSFLSSNGPGKLPQGYSDRIISYPHTTLSFQRFNSKILNNGYDLEWTFEDSFGIYQIRNEKIIGKGLLYIKQDC